jgi:hypothetical protein
MNQNNNKIPRDLYDAEDRLRSNVKATDAFLEEHSAVFEQFQELVSTRNDLIDEGKALCKKHKCGTELFKTHSSTKIVYDPESFRTAFGPKKLIQACDVSAKKVKSMVEAGLLDEKKLKSEVEKKLKVSMAVTPRHKKWEIS